MNNSVKHWGWVYNLSSGYGGVDDDVDDDDDDVADTDTHAAANAAANAATNVSDDHDHDSGYFANDAVDVSWNGYHDDKELGDIVNRQDSNSDQRKKQISFYKT